MTVAPDRLVDLRRLAEAFSANRQSTGIASEYYGVANPATILSLLDRLDEWERRFSEAVGLSWAAEQRVAALEEGLREIVAEDYRGNEPSWYRKARSLLQSSAANQGDSE